MAYSWISLHTTAVHHICDDGSRDVHDHCSDTTTTLPARYHYAARIVSGDPGPAWSSKRRRLLSDPARNPDVKSKWHDCLEVNDTFVLQTANDSTSVCHSSCANRACQSKIVTSRDLLRESTSATHLSQTLPHSHSRACGDCRLKNDVRQSLVTALRNRSSKHVVYITRLLKVDCECPESALSRSTTPSLGV